MSYVYPCSHQHVAASLATPSLPSLPRYSASHITRYTLHAVTGRFLQQYHAYLALPGMSLHELVCFKFFLLVWHNSWHLEQEPRLLRHLRLLAVLLGVGVVVGGAGGGVEHVGPVVGWLAPRPVLPAVPVGVAVGGRAEGEHVEGGGGGAVQHPGPHQHTSWFVWAGHRRHGRNGRTSHHTRVLIEWL